MSIYKKSPAKCLRIVAKPLLATVSIRRTFLFQILPSFSHIWGHCVLCSAQCFINHCVAITVLLLWSVQGVVNT